jgi:hypothetical protein
MKNMKIKLLFALCFGILLISCKLSENHFRQTVFLNLETRNLPDTAKVSTPFDITVSTKVENTCIGKLQFIVEPYADSSYNVYARAIWENHGESCNELVELRDSTIQFTISHTGKYFFYFLYDDKFNKDSIIIIP